VKKLISVIGPMYNEESLVKEFCNRIAAVFESLSGGYTYEILLVNDGSRDSTLEKMVEEVKRRPGIVTVVNLSRNFGLEGALRAGLRSASGDAVVVMDADLQDPPHVLPRLIEKWEQGADIVNGRREKRLYDNFFKRLSSKIFYKMLGIMSGKLAMTGDVANFRLLGRKAVDLLLSLPEVNPVFRVQVPFIGMKTDEVTYSRTERHSGQTKYNLENMIPYAMNSITGLSVVPLRKIAYGCPFSLLSAFLFILLSIFSSGYWRAAFLVCAVLGLFSFVLFAALAIMSEYIGQIMTEVKRRPASIIYETIRHENIASKEGA